MRRSAGLPLSVGQASLGLRIFLTTIISITGAICISAGIFISRVSPVAAAAAVILIVPLGLVALIAAAYILVPLSRAGVWLDGFLPRLREPRIALLTAAVIWSVAAVITL
ncbi:MAG TPA: hypothetical protein VGF69_09475 [Thermoanaerobaculia bacterium]|jgi:hypothetical protein